MTYPFADPLAQNRDVQLIVKWLLQKGMELSQTDLGNVQLMNWTAGCLEIKAQHGFDQEFLRFFERVGIAGGSACARALRQRHAIIIEDITADREFASCREVVGRAGVRAIQSTPMITKSGALFGVISTHFPVAHRPPAAMLRELQHAAQLAAHALLRVRVDQRTWQEQIESSRDLLRKSQRTIARADAALARALWMRDS
jgi:GAF domain-containing protein